MVRKSQTLDLSSPVRQFARPVATILQADSTIESALHTIRSRRLNHKIIYFYVVDAHEKLLGVVSTRSLLLARPEQIVRDVMAKKVVSVKETATLSEAMEILHSHQLLALPVINHGGKLMGIIDIELYTEDTVDVAESRTVNDVFQFIGLSLQQIRKPTAWANFKMRMPWLVGNIVSGVICAVIAMNFHAVLQQVVLVATFIPLVLTLSESISMQSMTITLQYLRGPRRPLTRVLSRCRIEWKIAALLGVACGLLVALAVLLFGQGWAPALVLACSILGSMFASATIGIIMPACLHLWRLDPHVASGPVVLMVGDVLTTSIYLLIATWLLT